MRDLSPERFGRYVKEAARAAGYDVDSPRGGGRKELAEAAGMSAASVSRTLNGLTIPERSFFRPLAEALEVSTEDLLRAAGVHTGEPRETHERQVTPAEAARRLGIRAPENVAAFEVLVTALLSAERQAPSP